MPKERPLVGFDRFIRWEWAEHALELACAEKPISELKDYQHGEIAGKSSARNAFILLKSLWFGNNPSIESLRMRALALYPEIPMQEHLTLHWGMAIASFPFFQQTTAIIGRLLRLQGNFQGKEITNRTHELYSNLNTVPRATTRIIQTLVDWNVLLSDGNRIPTYSPGPLIKLTSTTAIHWLLEANMIGIPDHQWRLIDLLRVPCLFPFDISEHGIEAIYQNKNFCFSKDSYGDETVSLL